MHIREKSQDKKFGMRVFRNTTVNFQKHLEHTRKKSWGGTPRYHNERKNIGKGRVNRPTFIDISM